MKEAFSNARNFSISTLLIIIVHLYARRLILILLFTFEEVRNTRKHIIMGAVVTDLICMIYASTDEFHQTFVDGRSGKSADVLIDTSGTVFATIILCLIIVCAGNRRRKNEQLER